MPPAPAHHALVYSAVFFVYAAAVFVAGLLSGAKAATYAILGACFVLLCAGLLRARTSSHLSQRRLEAMLARNQKLRTIIKRLSSENRAKSEFLAVLGHELRNPLAPVMNSLELLKLKMEEGAYSDLLGIVKTAAMGGRTLARLLDDLLDIVRIAQGKFELRSTAFELQSVANLSVSAVDMLMRAKNHSVSIDLPAEPLWIKADPMRIQQMLTNLLSNAGKYTPPGGRIELSTVYDVNRNSLRLCVRDNGYGIERQHLADIFQPYAQLTRNTPLVKTGLGIGLTLTKRLVDLHKGTIRVESGGSGKGSVFVIELPVPLADAPHETRTRESGKSSASPALERAILVVDDNESAARGLSILLEHDGHHVYTASSGEEALLVLERAPSSIVLLDIGLPEQDGYEVAGHIRARYGEAPMLVALTGYGQDEDRRKALAAGFNAHLTKPASIEDIRGLLRTAYPAYSEKGPILPAGNEFNAECSS